MEFLRLSLHLFNLFKICNFQDFNFSRFSTIFFKAIFIEVMIIQKFSSLITLFNGISITITQKLFCNTSYYVLLSWKTTCFIYDIGIKNYRQTHKINYMLFAIVIKSIFWKKAIISSINNENKINNFRRRLKTFSYKDPILHKSGFPQ